MLFWKRLILIAKIAAVALSLRWTYARGESGFVDMNEYLKTTANQYRMMWHSHVIGRHRFALMVVWLVDEHAETSWVDIGKACAEAVGRDRPYDRCWARNIYNAGKAFPDEPKSQAERRRFNMLYRGGKVEHDTQDEAQRKIIATPERNASMAVAFAKRAVDAGADSIEVVKAVAEAVGVDIGELHRDRRKARNAA